MPAANFPAFDDNIMKCMAPEEIRAWLATHQIAADPYAGGTAPSHYIQFYAPLRHRQLEAFIRHYFHRIANTDEAIVQIVDWSPYEASEMLTIAALRATSGESRPLIVCPGHLLSEEEREFGIALFGLAASYLWKAYLYSPSSRSTLYNWEGEIFDFWTDSTEVVTEMQEMLKEFCLSETTETESSDSPNR